MQYTIHKFSQAWHFLYVISSAIFGQKPQINIFPGQAEDKTH